MNIKPHDFMRLHRYMLALDKAIKTAWLVMIFTTIFCLGILTGIVVM